MKKSICLSNIILLFLSAILFANTDSDFDNVFKRIADKLAKASARLTNKTVAVYGFEVIGRPDDEYAVYATEKLTHEIVENGTYAVIERSRIDEVLKEQDFSLSGAIDSGTASKIGKILSVDAVITGTIRVTDKDAEFIARIIQSEKGLVLGSADERIAFQENEKNDETPPAAQEGKETHRLSTDKSVYSKGEDIVLTFSGLPGNETDWITLVPSGTPDDDYGTWFYTNGEESGTHVFTGLAPGDYEIRLYFDYPAGGYNVQGRIKLKVVTK